MTEAVIIIISVKGRDHEIIRGLEAGADDYVVKPFDYLLLRARLLACLRRVHSRPMAPVRLANTEALLMADPNGAWSSSVTAGRCSSRRANSSCCNTCCATAGACQSGGDLTNVWGPDTQARTRWSSSSSTACA